MYEVGYFWVGYCLGGVYWFDFVWNCYVGWYVVIDGIDCWIWVGFVFDGFCFVDFVGMWLVVVSLWLVCVWYIVFVGYFYCIVVGDGCYFGVGRGVFYDV